MNIRIVYFLSILFFITIILITLIYKIDRTLYKFHLDPSFLEKLNTKATAFFPTYTYNLLLSGYNTKDNKLGFEKNPPEEINIFIKDVRSGNINTIILNNVPYSIEYLNEDRYYVYFRIEHKCSLLPLDNCRSFNQNSVYRLPRSFVHILAFRL